MTEENKVDRDAWYTPEKYMEYVRRVLGGITVDPFSCAAANNVVGAEVYYTKDRSAFDADLHGDVRRVYPSPRMFANPPYSKDIYVPAANLIVDWASKMSESIALTANNTETKGSQILLRNADAICLVDHRIKFWCDDGKQQTQPRTGHIFYYFGYNPEKFKQVFQEIGAVIGGNKV